MLARLVEMEARFRRHWAQHQGQPTDAELFGDLRAIAADLAASRKDAARQRLMKIERRVQMERAARHLQRGGAHPAQILQHFLSFRRELIRRDDMIDQSPSRSGARTKLRAGEDHRSGAQYAVFHSIEA